MTGPPAGKLPAGQTKKIAADLYLSFSVLQADAAIYQINNIADVFACYGKGTGPVI